MAKKFYLSDKQNIKLIIPEKYRSTFGDCISSCPKSKAAVYVNASVPAAAAKNPNIKKKKKKKAKVNLLGVNKFVRVAAFAVMFYSLAVLCNYASGYIADIELNNAITDEFGVEFKDKNETADDEAVRPVPQYPIEEDEEGGQRFSYPHLSSMDSIKNLQEKHEDFVFWMYIENTSISYAVVQAEDNDYYLRRNIYGETNLSGTLFLDYRNERDMPYGNNIVYGHNMQNGTMFGTLKKYETKEYFDSHQMIYTYTADEVTAWRIFSVYETTTENYYIQTNFINKDNYYEFISGLQRDSMHESDVALDADDVILTLSTCHKYDYDNGRFVVHAVKEFTAPIS